MATSNGNLGTVNISSLNTAGYYIFTYTVPSTGICPDEVSTVTIIVLDENPLFYLVDNPTVADLTASIRPTGTVSWYTDATLTTPLVITDTLIDGEDYFATQTTASGCESSVSVQINVIVNNVPTPTVKDVSKEYCINDDGTYSILENLGLKVNTKHREQFPYISDLDVLYFASDGHLVYGGLDVFRSNSVNGSFDNPVNLGSSINSNLDDFAYTIREKDNKGFVSSNRSGFDRLYIALKERKIF